MKDDYKRILKKELHDLEQALRKGTHCTRAQMAELLCLDPRSLTYLENETYMCCALTMALLLKQLPNANDWLNELWKKFDAAAKIYETNDREAV